MLLAAGKGDRIAEASGGRPKVLMEIGGKSLLEHNICLLRKHSVKKIVINTHYQAEMIRKFLSERIENEVEILISHEPFLLGTAGGVKKALPHLGKEPFFVIYGDNYSDFDLTALMRTHENRKPEITLGVFYPDKVMHTGVLAGHVKVNAEGEIIDFVEMRGSQDVPEGFAVNAGVMMLNAEVLDMVPNNKSWDFSRDVFPTLLDREKTIWSDSHVSYVLASDTPEAYRKTCAAAEKIKSRNLRWEDNHE